MYTFMYRAHIVYILVQSCHFIYWHSQEFEGHGTFHGIVRDFDDGFYKIVYGDADFEWMDDADMLSFRYEPPMVSSSDDGETHRGHEEEVVPSPLSQNKSKSCLHSMDDPPYKKFKIAEAEDHAVDEAPPTVVTSLSSDKKDASRLPAKPPPTGLTPTETRSLWRIHGLQEKSQDWKLATLPVKLQRDSRSICDFFLFVHERHSIWVRRNLDMSPPWTASPILQREHFCNVYRELDRGTAFFHSHILDLQESRTDWGDDGVEWLVAVLWASYTYRLVNRMESFTTAGFPDMNNLSVFFARAQKIRDVGSFFTGAHQTTSFANYNAYLQKVAEGEGTMLQKVAAEIYGGKQSCQQAIMALPGVGLFMVWQIICDLQESRCLDLDDSYCQLGPGAKGKCGRYVAEHSALLLFIAHVYPSLVSPVDGLRQIFTCRGKVSDLELTQQLVAHQSDVYSALEIDFPYWEGKRLTLKELEHALCEYSKFNRCNASNNSLRSWQSQSWLDEGKACRLCKENDPKGNICDTCFLFFCEACCFTPPESKPSPSWMCFRCRHLTVQ